MAGGDLHGNLKPDDIGSWYAGGVFFCLVADAHKLFRQRLMSCCGTTFTPFLLSSVVVERISWRLMTI
jgi:hypothetical protein